MKDYVWKNPEGRFAPQETGDPGRNDSDSLRAAKLIEALTDHVCDHATESLEAVEGAIARRIILRVLDKTGGNQTEAAKLLGIKRTTLNYKLKKLNIRVPRPRRMLFR